jgi:ribosome-binding factor A
VLAGLRSAHGYLQHRVADELHLKHTPVLSFIYDETTERAARVRELIDATAIEGGDDERRP